MSVPQGYQELLVEQMPAMFRRALLLTHNWHYAEDLVQDSAEQALRKWKQVNNADSPAAYLQMIVTNVFRSMIRKRSYQETPAEIVVPDTVDPWASIEAEISIAQDLAKLAPLERIVLIARYMDDLPVKEVAKTLGKSESWVKTTAHRALATLNSPTKTPDPPQRARRRMTKGGDTSV